ncbi:hypothetical protein L1987_02993 [Smallanthus sonchifolius]|uniref:Uncharacterized protein n=1 Tax=Smallanthus sonchifolius TaxID=185202 RepID=A0ACB9K9E6_9ASTR|nr:hypothetical protein L1987_02993 [Smallanthus sonchifolius]
MKNPNLHNPLLPSIDSGESFFICNDFSKYERIVSPKIADETDGETGRTKQISSVPIYLSIYSPNGEVDPKEWVSPDLEDFFSIAEKTQDKTQSTSWVCGDHPDQQQPKFI